MKKIQDDLLPSHYYRANLPVEVVKRYALMVYNQFKVTKRDNKADLPGAREMYDVTGVSEKALYNIVFEKRSAVKLETCDKIALHGDFSLEDIFQETVEWAKENPQANWPDAYLPKTDESKKRRKKGTKGKARAK